MSVQPVGSHLGGRTVAAATSSAVPGDVEPCARSVARSTVVGIAEPDKVAGGGIDCVRADARVAGAAEEDTVGAEVYGIAGADVDGSAEGGSVGVDVHGMEAGG
jgi:hypothetical protein